MNENANALSDGAARAVNLQAAEIYELFAELMFKGYAELMLKSLVINLKHLPAEWSNGWLTLDPRGRYYLAEEGIPEIGLWLAINAGVREGLILRQVKRSGFPCIALREKVEGRR